MRYCAALILGSLLPLAFAPYLFWPLAIVIPALLLWVLDAELSVRRVFITGLCFGLGYFGFGVYWVYNSLHDFGQAPPVVAGAITVLMIACLAVFPALALTICDYAKRYLGTTAIWMLPLLWFGFEWLKGWILTGMPWLSLGYSQTDSPLAGFAPVVGVYGIGALCVLMAVALFLLIRDRRYLLLAVLGAIPVTGLLLQQVEWTEPQALPLKVTLVQGNIPQEIKWQYQQRQNIFNTYRRETNQHWDSDLIVWPETALPGHSEEIEASVLQPLQQTVIDRGTPILTGLVVSENDGKIFYNSVLLLGAQRSFYHKRHLVMFGEYYPLRWLLDFMRAWINIPYSDLTPGPDEQPLIVVGNTVLGVSICFEDVFSRDVLLALPAANLLVNLSNDAWFGDSSAPHQHLQIAQMRAQETERPMLRSTNTGVSAFIDHKGAIVAQSEQFTIQSITTSVRGRSGLTPFYYFAMIQGPLAILILIVGLLISTPVGRRLFSQKGLGPDNNS